ncbi:MAG: (d)CMP kinase [Clostridia bacterium]|nr:(d)CMP kinase [Clostridia bacterium]
MYIITIDGTASSGKSTIAKFVADKLNIAHINSGEAYRAIAYFMLSKGISPDDSQSIKNALEQNSFKMLYNNGAQTLLVNGEDVTKHLHTNQINAVVSQYAQNPQVIHKASDMARDVSKSMSVVMEGRNLGSFCFPEAKYKFFVDCDAKERANRRFKEMQQKGVDVDFDTIYQQTLERDKLDRTREVAPLVVPKNAIVLDSTTQTAEQVAQKIVNVVLDNENKAYINM